MKEYTISINNILQDASKDYTINMTYQLTSYKSKQKS
jgi:hypothetical protein